MCSELQGMEMQLGRALRWLVCFLVCRRGRNWCPGKYQSSHRRQGGGIRFQRGRTKENGAYTSVKALVCTMVVFSYTAEAERWRDDCRGGSDACIGAFTAFLNAGGAAMRGTAPV